MMFDPMIFFLALKTISASENICAARRGICVNFRNCPYIIEVLKLPRLLTKEALLTLRNSHCGFEKSDPMVCCVNRKNTSLTTANVVPDLPDVTHHPNLRLLVQQSCGRTIQQKIMGGVRTSIFDYPWMALIVYETKHTNRRFRCGGTIISTRYILTAAHCVTSLPDDTKLIGVRVGEHNIGTERDCDKDKNGLEIQCAEKYHDFGVESFHFHPEYTEKNLRNDIALIRLNGSMNFNSFNVQPICLPFGSAATLHIKRAVVTGWGETELSSRSYELLQVILPVIPNEECEKMYRHISIWYKQMCAGGNNMDSCKSDSGGPLQAPGIYNGAHKRFIQYGVVSYGQECRMNGIFGRNRFPGVYTKIAYYMDWILDTMKD